MDHVPMYSPLLERKKNMRKQFPLNFDWKYSPTFSPTYLESGHTFNDFENIMIPHTNKLLPYNHFSEEDYQFVSTYYKTFETPDMEPNSRLFIQFFGVSVKAEVYCNGSLLGQHEGSYTPFEFELTKHVYNDRTNELIVIVDSREIPNVPPFGNVVDYLVYGGIYREVTLEIRPSIYVKDFLLKTFDGGVVSASSMILDTTLLLSEPITPTNVVLELFYQGERIQTHTFIPESGEELHNASLIEDIKRWSIDEPTLYELTATIFIENEVVDQVHSRLGFRSMAFREEGFVLNNQLLKLIGLNRHQSYPYIGYAAPARLQRKDADFLKYDLGCNIVRCSHYMQSDHFINRCDEIGLLVFEEVPGWQYIGDDSFKQHTYQNLRDMILHHYNHPSIVIWGVRINESPDDHDFYTETNRIAHILDDSRPTGGVRNFPGSELLENVYTYNDFSHTGDNIGLTKPLKITKKLVPYLVTEYNGHMFPTKKFDTEHRRFEHAHRHLAVQDASFSNENISGAIGWCMSDYNTHIQFGSGDRICYHGVSDMFRIPKYAAAVYASQQSKKPVMVVSSNLVMGEYPATAIPSTYIFTNCDYVKVYKNDEYIDTFYSAWENYPHIPNAPIVIDDYIANQIHTHESYSPKVADKLKAVLSSFVQNGMKLDKKSKFNLFQLMAFHKITIKELMRLYGEYVGDWGKEGGKYRFEGYINDQCVLVSNKGSSKEMHVVVQPDDTVLQHKNTYDATRIVVKMVDEHMNDLPYAFNSFTVQTTEHLEVIGPKQQALIGGSIGVYVKTTGIIGLGEVVLQIDHFGEFLVKIEVTE